MKIIDFSIFKLFYVFFSQFSDFIFRFPEFLRLLEVFRVHQHLNNLTVAIEFLENFIVEVDSVEGIGEMLLVFSQFPRMEVDFIINDIRWWYFLRIFLYRLPYHFW